MPAAATDAGSIGDLFTSLGTKPPVLGKEYAELKERLRPPKATLDAAWSRVEQAVAKEVAEIQRRGKAVIPTVDFEELAANGGEFPKAVAEEIRKRGCVVVRNTVDVETALAAKQEAKQYIAANQGELVGFPKNNPMVWEVYWSKAQLKMRAHAQMLATQTALNRLWHCSSTGSDGTPAVDVLRPLTYCDRLRIRKAGDKSFTLGPHVDGGSTERWEDEEYRKVYRHIMEGEWEKYDAFDATHRADARYDLYGKNVGACTIFRSFQGWLSLSNSGEGKGTLRLAPLLREATAFLILRPFLDDVAPESFCGANPGKVQDLFPEFHQMLIDGMVSIPDVKPGDSVWWHCDLIHAVEAAHGGTEDASVFYIPSVPMTAKNFAYVQRQAKAFKLGETPPDFPQNHCEKSCCGRGSADDLSEEGQVAMGIEQATDGKRRRTE